MKINNEIAVKFIYDKPSCKCLFRTEHGEIEATSFCNVKDVFRKDIGRREAFKKVITQILPCANQPPDVRTENKARRKELWKHFFTHHKLHNQYIKVK